MNQQLGSYESLKLQFEFTRTSKSQDLLKNLSGGVTCQGKPEMPISLVLKTSNKFGKNIIVNQDTLKSPGYHSISPMMEGT